MSSPRSSGDEDDDDTKYGGDTKDEDDEKPDLRALEQTPAGPSSSPAPPARPKQTVSLLSRAALSRSGELPMALAADVSYPL
jgi:hypothetical protein